MKKIKILLIIAIAIVGAIIIYNHFEIERIENPIPNRLLNDYTLIDTQINFQNKSIDEANNLLNNTGILFMCHKDSVWCQYYAWILNESAILNGVSDIYYVDIKEDRTLNTNKYQKLVTKLSDYLYTDDAGEKRVFMPEVVFVKDGNIIAHDNETALIINDYTPEEYYTDSKIKELKNKLNSYFDLMNQKIVIEESESEI